jgi:hypothetical protein
MYTQLLPTNKGFKPRLNDSDNKCSRTSQAYIKGKDAKIQLVESHNNWASAAKRLLKPQKSLYCQFINGRQDLTHTALEQSTCTRTWHFENVTFLQQQKISAYDVLRGNFIFDCTPLTPPGTKAIVYDDHDKHTNRDEHDSDAWYVGPKTLSMLQTLYARHTSIQDSTGWSVLSNTLKMPHVSAMNTIKMAAQDLIHALWKPTPTTPVNLQPPHNAHCKILLQVLILQ